MKKICEKHTELTINLKGNSMPRSDGIKLIVKFLVICLIRKSLNRLDNLENNIQ